jgi:hypothetical protein
MRRGKPCRKPSVMRCLAAKKRAAVCITTGKRKRFFLMGRVDRLLPVVGAVLRAGLLVLPVSAHAGDAGGGGHARFAIKPMGVGGDVKAQLWDVVSVAKLAPDLSIKCEDSSSRYPWKIGIVSTVFWVGETGGGPANTRSAWDPNWEAAYGGVDDPARRNGFSQSRSGRCRTPSTWRCRTAICRQDG